MEYLVGFVGTALAVVFAHVLGYRACHYEMRTAKVICSFCAFPMPGTVLDICPRCQSLDHEIAPADWSFPDPEELRREEKL